MTVFFILAGSVLLQLFAAFLALRMIPITGGRMAWLALAGAIFLMALRRAMTLGTALINYPDFIPNFQTESVALIISGMVLFAMIMIRPLFESIRRSEQEIFAEKERIHVTLHSIGDGVVSFDTNGCVQYMNPVAEALCGISLSQSLGQPREQAVVLLDENNRLPLADSSIPGADNQNKKLDDKIILVNQRDHSEHSVEVMASPITNSESENIGTVMVIHDVTELKGMAQQLSYQASHDSLTGLINRHEFEFQLEKLLVESRLNGLQHAMCYLDMDDFKIVNDTCGHIAGDEMLKSITSLLKKQVRETDILARLGGDEFGILFDNCPAEQVGKVVDKISRAVSEFSFAWEENVFNASISIGVVPINCDSGSITDVLSAADSACYVAKERGRNCIHVYTEDDNEVARRHGQMQWVQHIQRALAEDRFTLYSQLIIPIARAKNSEIFTEILLRMTGEDGRIISPASFIHAAERYHLMPSIDRWVVRNVFAYIRSRAEGEDAISMYNINLSGQSLGDEEFLGYVLSQFSDGGVSFERICFEITETAVISNIVTARNFIEVLRGKGCKFALDDFGSGLSSFSYLKTLPVDFLKIDGNFIQGITHDKNDYNLVVSINQIGHVMGISTIAEFVEDEAIYKALDKIGIDYVQGYGISRPQELASQDTRLM